MCLRHVNCTLWARELCLRHVEDVLEEKNTLLRLSKAFAVETIRICTGIRRCGRGNVLLDQLLRSGTSIGANIREGNYAASRADFINKFQIALKECYETDYWLDVFKGSGMMTAAEYERLHAPCSKLRAMLAVSVRTAKENQTKAKRDHSPPMIPCGAAAIHARAAGDSRQRS